MGSWDWDLLSGECRWDEGQCSIFGVSQASFKATAENVRGLLHSDDRLRLEQSLEQAARSGQPCNAEFRIVRPSGELRWCIGAAAPSLDAGGSAVRISGVTVDITDRKEAEERQVLLAREVDHRARNALAVVQAILRLSNARTAEEFVASVDGRIRALARAHTLLSQSRWQGAHLNRLVDEELAPYRTSDAGRIAAEGPPVLLRSATAQAIALALHELATNAAKYGALSRESGKVAVSWTLQAEWLELRWSESGGPRAASPAGQGFGTRMIRATLERELGGGVKFEWLSDGLHCELRIPRSQIADPAPPPPGAPRSSDRPAPQASASPSAGQRILLVEDESLIAMMMRDMLVGLGFCVIGPFGDVQAALAAAEAGEIEAAVLDVNLNGDSASPVADALAARGVPFLLVTGYDAESVSRRYADVPILQKPIDPTTLRGMLLNLAAAASSSARSGGSFARSPR
jgi:PAS domain S-box-containing protein